MASSSLKENLILFTLGAAWAAGGAVLTFVLALSDRVIIIETRTNSTLSFLEKEIEHCVKNDVYQVDKMLLVERFKKGR